MGGARLSSRVRESQFSGSRLDVVPETVIIITIRCYLPRDFASLAF